MRTFAQNQKRSQKPVSSNIARSHVAMPRLHHRADLILSLQHRIGNQAVQRMIQTHAGELKTALTSQTSPHRGHEFGRIPRPPLGEAIPIELALNTPGDEYEREADRVAAKVMRMPEPQLQPACACGGGCPQCQTAQLGQENQRLLTKRAQPSGLSQTVVPPVVHEVLRSSGRPLDLSTRDFMGSRFGHDFIRIRIHDAARADQASRDLRARAFTFGRHIVFRQGEYDPGSTKGRQLLTHELTHTLQQGGELRLPLIQRQSMPSEGDSEGLDQTAKEKEKFSPKTGTTNTKLKGTYGDFSVEHGLTKVPNKTKSGTAGFGEYSIQITMTPNAKTGTSEIGFLQVYRQGKTGGGWAMKKGENFLTEEEAKRTEQKEGWAVDRANPKRDKTPLYGMFKNDKGALKQYSYTTVGQFKGSNAVLGDTPAVADPDRMEFTSTAMDISNGTQFGAVGWGFEFDSGSKKYSETVPELVPESSDRLKGRDRAMETWDKIVAVKDSGIDKIPHK